MQTCKLWMHFPSSAAYLSDALPIFSRCDCHSVSHCKQFDDVSAIICTHAASRCRLCWPWRRSALLLTDFYRSLIKIGEGLNATLQNITVLNLATILSLILTMIRVRFRHEKSMFSLTFFKLPSCSRVLKKFPSRPGLKNGIRQSLGQSARANLKYVCSTQRQR
jgi:hypothetical protein